ADDVDLGVERGVELRDGTQEHVDVLLPRHTPDEHDAVFLRLLETGRVEARVDTAGDRVHALDRGLVLEERRGLLGWCRDRRAQREGARRIRPYRSNNGLLQKLRQQRVLDHVLWHEVVGADDTDAALARLPSEPT